MTDQEALPFFSAPPPATRTPEAFVIQQRGDYLEGYQDTPFEQMLVTDREIMEGTALVENLLESLGRLPSDLGFCIRDKFVLDISAEEFVAQQKRWYQNSLGHWNGLQDDEVLEACSHIEGLLVATGRVAR